MASDDWQEQLDKYGKQAYESGKKLIFSVIKRPNFRKWRIELKTLVAHGEEQFDEEE